MIAAAVFVFNFLVNLRLKQINLPAYFYDDMRLRELYGLQKLGQLNYFFHRCSGHSLCRLFSSTDL